MARVRLNRTIAGPSGVFHAGDEIDVTDEAALIMAESGHADLLPEKKAALAGPEPAVEVAADPEPAAAELAVAPRQRVNPTKPKKRR